MCSRDEDNRLSNGVVNFVRISWDCEEFSHQNTFRWTECILQRPWRASQTSYDWYFLVWFHFFLLQIFLENIVKAAHILAGMNQRTSGTDFFTLQRNENLSLRFVALAWIFAICNRQSVWRSSRLIRIQQSKKLSWRKHCRPELFQWGYQEPISFLTGENLGQILVFLEKGSQLKDGPVTGY